VAIRTQPSAGHIGDAGHIIEALEHATRRAEIAREQAERLQRLTAALSHAATLPQVADAVMANSRDAFPESAGTVIVRITPAGDELDIFAVSEMPGEVFENWKRFPLSTDAPLAEAVRNSELMCLESPRDWERRYPGLTYLLEETGHRAQIIAPMIAGGRAIGAIGVAFAVEREFSAPDREFASALAGQCAVAIERARLFEVEIAGRAAAEKMSRAKSDFLAAMSHELRTPLNAIGGYAELLEMGIHGPVTPEQKVALDRIRTSQQHLAGLIESVLEFSQSEAGATPYSMENVNLGAALSICEQLTAPQIGAANIDYSVTLEDPDLVAHADSQKLRQILVNLISNAIKHTDAGGSISVSARSEGDTVQVSIRDTGHGIDEDNLSVIFEPFVQIEKNGGLNRGVGLGLPISRNLARGMGGDLTATSRLGEGSTFTLTLKRALPPV
jgi:signal transduction histidine kinase